MTENGYGIVAVGGSGRGSWHCGVEGWVVVAGAAGVGGSVEDYVLVAVKVAAVVNPVTASS